MPSRLLQRLSHPGPREQQQQQQQQQQPTIMDSSGLQREGTRSPDYRGNRPVPPNAVSPTPKIESPELLNAPTGPYTSPRYPMYQMVPVGDSPPLMPTHREHYND